MKQYLEYFEKAKKRDYLVFLSNMGLLSMGATKDEFLSAMNKYGFIYNDKMKAYTRLFYNAYNDDFFIVATLDGSTPIIRIMHPEDVPE